MPSYPKNRFSHQSYVRYVLTDEDLLQLYALFTPSEIIREFLPDRCRSESSIYNLIRGYGLDRPLKAKKYLQRIVVACCPEEVGFDDWEKLVEEKISYVRAEALAVLWKRIGKHEHLWAED